MKRFIAPLLLLVTALQTQGQPQYSVTVFNNATLLPPASFSAVWKEPVHPGLTVGYEFPWKKDSPFIQRFRFGGYYHQFVKVGLQAYTETVYRKGFNKFYGEAALGVGYLHSFLLSDQAVLKNGVYEQANGIGKPRLMFGPDFSLGYNLNQDRSVFLGYQVWMETPFVTGYVPLLPNGSVHLGVKFGLNKKGENQ